MVWLSRGRQAGRDGGLCAGWLCVPDSLSGPAPVGLLLSQSVLGESGVTRSTRSKGTAGSLGYWDNVAQLACARWC